MITHLDTLLARIFPPIGPDFYTLNPENTQLNPDQQAARRLLSFLDRDFTRLERLSGWKLDIQGQIGHLLLQHRLAVEAELVSQWQRADFFWRQVLVELKAFNKQDTNWERLVNIIFLAVDTQEMMEPVQLRQRLVDELFIDTHFAFYKGLVVQKETLSLKDRAFAHIDYIQQYLQFSGMSVEAVQFLLEEPWQTRVNLSVESKQWQIAIKTCTQRIKYVPNSTQFQYELAEIYYQATVAQLKEGNSTLQYWRNVNALKFGIRALKKCHKHHPEHLSIFEALSSLHYLLAIYQFNHGQVAIALASIQQAVTYNPRSEQSVKTRDEFIAIMKQMQVQLKALQTQTNLELTQEGKNLKKQAEKGFLPMDRSIKSKSAQRNSFTFQVAQAIYLWRTIGLPEPPKGWKMGANGDILSLDLSQRAILIDATQGWSTLALKLWDSLGIALSHSPRSNLEIRAMWEHIIANEPDLVGLDSKLICAFLERSFFEEKGDQIPATPPSLSMTPTLLQPTSNHRKFGTEPFLPWLFSRQDRRIKLQALLASVFLLAATGVMLREQRVNTTRDSAYQQILVAKSQQNDLGVVENAELFLSDAPLGADKRNEQVTSLYSESLVRWFAQQEDQLDASAQKHLERYRNALKTVKPVEK
jgi:tetratricopeptide (TPR) repeat protein